MADSNSIDKNFIFDLISAVDYVGDLETYIHRCEAESLSCDIQYLKDKVTDIKSELNYMYDRLYSGVDNKT
jgi:hypothetical protein